jgi:hypothetical protein
MSRHPALYQVESISVLDDPDERERFSRDAILEIIRKKRLRPLEAPSPMAYEMEQRISQESVLPAWKSQTKKKIPIMEPFGPSEGQIQRALLEYQRCVAERTQQRTAITVDRSLEERFRPRDIKEPIEMTSTKGSGSSSIPETPVVEIILDDPDLSDEAITKHRKKLQPTKSSIGLKLFEDSYSDVPEESSADEEDEEDEDVEDIQDSSLSHDEDYEDPSMFRSKHTSKRAIDDYSTGFVIGDDEVVWDSSSDDVLEDCEAILTHKENAKKKAKKALHTKKRNFPHTPPTPPHKASDSDYDGDVHNLHFEAPLKRKRLLRIQTSSDEEDIDDDLA